jgi:hypothetical protein
MLGENMLSVTDPDKLSVLMPEPIRWYGVLVLWADPKGAFVARKTGDQIRDAAVGSPIDWMNGQKSSMAAGCKFE